MRQKTTYREKNLTSYDKEGKKGHEPRKQN